MRLNQGLTELADQVVAANVASQATTVEIQREYSRLLKTCSEVDYKFKVITDENKTLKQSLKKSDELLIFKEKEIAKAKREKYYVAGAILAAIAGVVLVAK